MSADARGAGELMKRVLDADVYPLGGTGRRLLRRLCGEYLLWSRKMHIVSKGDIPGEIAAQMIGSLAMLRFAVGEAENPGAAQALGRTADIGSGFGFPALVWMAAERDLEMTMIERREKAAGFLLRQSSLLGVEADVIRADASEVSPAGSFRTVTSKAAGRLSVMMPVAARLLEPGGRYITVKAGGWREELRQVALSPLQLERARRAPGGPGFLLSFVRE